MTSNHALVHIDDISPENMDAGKGWKISEFRLPISKKHGSSTTAFHARFFPGSTHKKHLHTNCDEITYYLSGHGLVGNGPDRAQLRPGLCRLIPTGVEHFYFNDDEASESGEVVGFYVGAGGVDETGYAYTGDVTEEDIKQPRKGISHGIFRHIDDVTPEKMNEKEGWPNADFRLPISKQNGSTTTLYRANFLPGATHHLHRLDNCEEIYYIMQGSGIAGVDADRFEVRSGHFHYIPKGVPHWLHNLSSTEPLEILGIYVGAGSIEEAGYVYMGEAKT